ncbi:hypothetical protein IAU60_006288 [Kwoniella sp. DSM 27419]
MGNRLSRGNDPQTSNWKRYRKSKNSKLTIVAAHIPPAYSREAPTSWSGDLTLAPSDRLRRQLEELDSVMAYARRQAAELPPYEAAQAGASAAANDMRNNVNPHRKP